MKNQKIQNSKGQATDWEKIDAKHRSDKGPESRIHKEFV